MAHEPRRLLVTGAAGFIGSNFVHYWLGRYPGTRVVALDALTYAGNMDNLGPVMEREEFRFVHGDILDYGLIRVLLRDEGLDTIVHFAAESHVDRSIHGPDRFIETNVTGTHTLLKAAKDVWLGEGGRGDHLCHHVSTDEVYGSLGPGDPPFTESTPYAPNSPYAASKAASDHLVRAYHKTYGLRVTTSNCSNNYGPYQFPEKLIPLVILNCLENRPIPVYGDGSQVRDWLHVEDHNRGIDLVIRQGAVGQTYNIGGNNERRNMEIITTLCDILDRLFQGDPALGSRFPQAPPNRGVSCRTLVTHVKDRPGHDRRYAIDAAKISSELGYLPRRFFREAMEETVTWYLENEQWWRRVMDGSYRDWIKTQYGG